MSLTMGTGPLAPDPGGRFSRHLEEARRDAGALWFERSPREVTVVVAGEIVARSRDARLLHETGELPVYYFPEADVRTDLLEEAREGERSPLKGPTRRFDVVVGDRRVRRGAWSHPEPPDDAPDLSGYVAFDFGRMDRWLEEDEEIEVHPRDPYHRVDARRSRRSVRVRIGGETVARSDRPLMVFETSLPPRYYIPLEDVREDLLEESDTVTGCPYKGRASHFHVRIGGDLHEDAAWSYRDPEPGMEALRGHVAFYDGTEELDAGDADAGEAAAPPPERPPTIQEEAGVAPSRLEDPPQAEGERE